MDNRRIRTVDLHRPSQSLTSGFCEVLLIRHGEQVHSPEMTLGEMKDPPLSSVGLQQARALGRRLASTELDAIYCSDLRRALSTAGEISVHHDLEPVVDRALQEINIFEHAPQDQQAQVVYPGDQLATILRNVMSSRRNTAYPDCEDVTKFRQRVVATLDRIVGRHSGNRIAIVCHGGVIHAILGDIFETESDYLMSLEHTSITTLRSADDRRAIFTVNDYAHLEGDERWASKLAAGTASSS